MAGFVDLNLKIPLNLAVLAITSNLNFSLS